MVKKIRFYVALLSALTRRNQRRITLAAILLILAVFLIKILLPTLMPKVVAGYQELRRPTFVEGVVGSPSSPNPIFDSTQTARDISSLVFRGLTRVDERGNLQPDLASSFKKVSETEYRFYLKKNVLWQDGEKFTSDDVIYTIDLTQDPKYKSPLAENFTDVQIEKINDYELAFKLKEPFSPFPFATMIGIIPKHISLKKYQPIGTGPFSVKKITKDQIVLASDNLNLAFNFYENMDKAKLALKMGQVHALGGLGPQEVDDLKRFGSVNLYTATLPFQEAVAFFNTKDSALQVKSVRQALSYAVDKENLRKLAGGSKSFSAKNELPLFNWVDTTKERYPFNLEEAKKLLGSAGYTLDKGIWQKKGQKLSLTITCINDPELNSIANFLSEAWTSLGVAIETKVVDPEALRTEIIPNRDFQVLVNFQEISPDPDQYVLWHTTQIQKANITGISKSGLDKILEDARETADQNTRAEKYQLFTTLLADEAPAIFLYYPQYTWVVSKKVTGINLSNFAVPADRFNSYKSWKIEQNIF